MTDIVLGIRIKLDGKEVSGEIRAQAADLEKLGQAAKQSNNQAKTAADQYLASLKKQADTLGMTKTQTLQYEASQHKLTTAQRAQVAANIQAIDAHERHQQILGRVKLAALGAATAIGYGFVQALKGSVAAAVEAEQADLRLQAVVRATGQVAGLSARELIQMAGAFQDRLGINDEAVKGSMAVLLTFRSVSRASFGEAIEVAANLSKVMGTDLQSATLHLGKALEEPEQGLVALRRAGVSFSDAQKDMIKDLVETGNQAQAITMILQIMKEQGLDKVAEAMNQGLSGAINKVKNEWDDLLEAFGRTPAAKATVEDSLGVISKRLREIKDVVEDGNWADKTLALVGAQVGLLFMPGVLVGAALDTASSRARARAGAREAAESAASGVGSEDAEYGQAIKRLENARDAYTALAKKFIPDTEKMAAELKKLDEIYATGVVSAEKYAKTQADIRAKFAKTGQKSEYDQLIGSIREKTAVMQAELSGQEKLSEGQQMAMKIMVALRDNALKPLTDAKKIALTTDLEQMLADEKRLAQRKQETERYINIAQAEQAEQEKLDQDLARMDDARGKVILAMERQTGVGKDAVKIAEYEVSLMGRSETERRELVAVMKAELDVRQKIKDAIDSGAFLSEQEQEYMRQQARQQALDASRVATIREQFAETKRLNDEIGRGLADALMRGFESGKTFAANFRDTLVNMFKTMVLRPVIQWIVSPISGAITATLGGLGIPGLAGAATGGTGTGGLGGAGNLLSLGNSAINLFSGEGLLGGVGSALFGGAGAYSAALGLGSAAAGSQAALLAAQTGVFGAAGLSATAGAAGAGAASAALTAVPYVGLALAAISLLAGGRSKKISAVDLGDPGGVAAGALAQYQQLAGALGATGPAPSFGFGSNTGRQGQNPNFALDVNAGLGRYVVGEFVGSYRKLDDATLQTEVARGVLFALQGSTLPSYLRAYFDSLAPAALDKTAIDNALAFAGSLKQIREQLIEARTPAEQAGEMLGKMFTDLATSAAGWRDDFKAAIEQGLTPETLGRWQALSAAVAQTAQLAGPILTRMGAAIGLQDQTRDLFISDLSPLTMAQRLAEASGRYGSTLAAARGGDAAALAGLSGLSRTYLQEARGFYASSPDYTSIFGQVQADVQGLVTDTLTEQSIQFSQMGLTLEDIAANTKDLDSRIATALQGAIDSWQAAQIAAQRAAADQITAAVEQQPIQMALVMESASSATFIDDDETRFLRFNRNEDDNTD